MAIRTLGCDQCLLMSQALAPKPLCMAGPKTSIPALTSSLAGPARSHHGFPALTTHAFPAMSKAPTLLVVLPIGHQLRSTGPSAERASLSRAPVKLFSEAHRISLQEPTGIPNSCHYQVCLPQALLLHPAPTGSLGGPGWPGVSSLTQVVSRYDW